MPDRTTKEQLYVHHILGYKMLELMGMASGAHGRITNGKKSSLANPEGKKTL